jgi:aminoglycoside phosphotransferase (APT) family kinase protein
VDATSPGEDVDQPRRSPPPPAALEWVARAVGGRVVAVRRLPGATSSVLHELVVEPTGRRLVLRRYAHPAWRPEGGELVTREATALDAARSSPVPAPALVTADPTGDDAGVPALVMTRLGGRPVLRRRPGWVEALAGVHRAMAGWVVATPDLHRLPCWDPWHPADPTPPPWSRRPRAWERAVELVVSRPPPAGPHGPIHRDLHPGNILFRRGRPSGVVDWPNACIGPRASDLAQCRMNLAVLDGVATADAFLTAASAVAGSYDPWWDLQACVSLLPDPTFVGALVALGAAIDQPSARRALDELVGRSLSASE